MGDNFIAALQICIILILDHISGPEIDWVYYGQLPQIMGFSCSVRGKVSSFKILDMRAGQSSATNLTNASTIQKLKIKDVVLAANFFRGSLKVTKVPRTL